MCRLLTIKPTATKMKKKLNFTISASECCVLALAGIYIYINVLYIFRVGFARSMNNKKRRRKTAKMYIFFFFVQGSFKQWQCYCQSTREIKENERFVCFGWQEGKKEKKEYFNTYIFFCHHPPRVPFFFSFNLPTLEEFLFIFIYNFTCLFFLLLLLVLGCCCCYSAG